MKVSSKEKTVGQASLELQQKDEKINSIDLQREIHKGNENEDSWENQVRLAVKRGLQDFEKDFYVVVLFKKERTMINVVRQYFFPRESCPTPEFDQVVYSYDRKDEKLEMLWVVPDHQTSRALANSMGDIDPEYWELAAYARAFWSGELDQKCAAQNGEVYA